MSIDVLKGDIVVRSEKDETVVIHMNREDLLDFYVSLVEKSNINDAFAYTEVITLIRRFFVNSEDVSTDPNTSGRFYDPDNYDDILKYRS